MQSIKNDIKETDQKNDDSLFAKEIESITHKKNKTRGPVIEIIEDILLVAGYGILFYVILAISFNEFVSKYSGYLIFSIVSTCAIIFCNLYFSERLISTKTYEVFDIIIETYPSILLEDIVFFSYIDLNNKLEKDKISANQLIKKLYISNDEKSYIEVENWGAQGKIQRKVVAKFICNKEQYEEFKESFSWNKKLT